jgi:hypothetical protein
MNNRKRNPRWDLKVPGLNLGKVVFTTSVVLVLLGLMVMSTVAFKNSIDMPIAYENARGQIEKMVFPDGTELLTWGEIKPWAQQKKGCYKTVYVP